MTFFKDLAASFQIFASNFTDRFGLSFCGRRRFR